MSKAVISKYPSQQMARGVCGGEIPQYKVLGFTSRTDQQSIQRTYGMELVRFFSFLFVVENRIEFPCAFSQ